MTGSRPLPREEYDRKWVGRVLARSVIGPGGCLLWQGFCGWKGYAQTNYRGRGAIAHRKLYEIHHGVELGRWDFVCHRCDTPHCVNIDHLWLGTPKDNMEDCAEKNRGVNQKRTHCIRGHELAGDNLRTRADGRRVCRECERGRWQREKRGTGPQSADKTHCLRGHPFDEENTYVAPNGYRQCKACHKMRREGRLYSKGTPSP